MKRESESFIGVELKGKRDLGSKIWSTAVIYQDTLIFGSLDHHLYGLDTRDGKTIWAYETGGAIASSPLLKLLLIWQARSRELMRAPVPCHITQVNPY